MGRNKQALELIYHNSDFGLVENIKAHGFHVLHTII